MAKLIHVKATNLLGLKSANVHLKGRSAVIGGRNGQGKSSFQKAILLGLAGGDAIPGEPTHNGADAGEVEVKLDNGMVVQRTVTKDRKTKLRITQSDNPNVRFDKPQTTLDALFGDLSFDPGEFLSLGDKSQAECLMGLGGLDFTDQNKARTANYDERTQLGRELKRLEGELAGRPKHDDAPAEEQDPKTVLVELEAAQGLVMANAAERSEVDRLDSIVKSKQREIDNIGKRLDDIKAQIITLNQQATALRKDRDVLIQDGERAIDKADKLRETSSTFQPPDLDAIKAKATTIEQTNAKVRANRERAALQERLDLIRADHESMTQRIQAIDDAKTKALQAVNLPIDGLAFDETGVRYKGVPFAQCSESEQWAVATAVAFARNPQGVVFVSRSGGMDKATRKSVLECAAGLGVQVLLEVVDDAEDVNIVIEQGAVAENRLEAVPA